MATFLPFRWLFGALAGLWVYFWLPATAFLFFELYHATHLEFVYWGYSLLRIGDYYLDLSGYRVAVSLMLALSVVIAVTVVNKFTKRTEI